MSGGGFEDAAGTIPDRGGDRNLTATRAVSEACRQRGLGRAQKNRRSAGSVRACRAVLVGGAGFEPATLAV
jgi:hypothetical protein